MIIMMACSWNPLMAVQPKPCSICFSMFAASDANSSCEEFGAMDQGKDPGHQLFGKIVWQQKRGISPVKIMSWRVEDVSHQNWSSTSEFCAGSPASRARLVQLFSQWNIWIHTVWCNKQEYGGASSDNNDSDFAQRGFWTRHEWWNKANGF